jgi:hypothetical protein
MNALVVIGEFVKKYGGTEAGQTMEAVTDWANRICWVTPSAAIICLLPFLSGCATTLPASSTSGGGSLIDNSSLDQAGAKDREIDVQQLDLITRTLDQMADKEAEYGTMGVSSPVLVAPNSDFAFNLTANSDTFFKDAQSSVQGTASELQQTAVSAGLGVTASFNPAVGGAYLAQLQQYQQAVTNNNNVQNVANLKLSLQNGAAYTQYQQAMAAANQLTDPAAKASAISQAQQTLAASLVAPATQTLPSYPTATTQPAASGNLVSPATDLLQQFTTPASPANFQGSSSPPSLGITDRTAILTAAGDNATKGMFQLLGDPSLADEFRDKRVFFEVVTVSVEPGWRTQKNFAADVATNVYYQYLPARPALIDEYIHDSEIPTKLRVWIEDQKNETPHIESPIDDLSSNYVISDPSQLNRPLYGGPGPRVAVISPLTDTQTLDLQSNSQTETDIALSLNIAAQLASAGLGAQAQAFLNYAGKLQKQVATVSPDVAINAYSQGNQFGFQVGPRLRAIADPTSTNYSGGAEILDRQSFPALVIIGLDQDACIPQVYWNTQNRRYDLYEPALCLQSANRWVPARAANTYENSKLLYYFDTLLFDRSSYPTESEVITLANQARHIRNYIKSELTQITKPDLTPYKEAVDESRAKFEVARDATDAAGAEFERARKNEENRAASLRNTNDSLMVLQAAVDQANEHLKSLIVPEKVGQTTTQAASRLATTIPSAVFLSAEAAQNKALIDLDAGQHALLEAERDHVTAVTGSDAANADYLKETADLHIAEWELKQAVAKLNDAASGARAAGGSDYASMLGLYFNRLDNLEQKLLGTQSTSYLPAKYLLVGGRPTLSAMEPAMVDAGTTATVSLSGENLSDVDLSNIRIVSGDVNPGDETTQPPFGAQLLNGVLLLTFTPSTQSSYPTSAEIDADISLAQTNLQSWITLSQQWPNQVQFQQQKYESLVKTNASFVDTSDLDKDTSNFSTESANFASLQAGSIAWDRIKKDGAWNTGTLREMIFYLAEAKKSVADPTTDSHIADFDDALASLSKAPSQNSKIDITVGSFGKMDAAVGALLSSASQALISSVQKIGNDVKLIEQAITPPAVPKAPAVELTNTEKKLQDLLISVQVANWTASDKWTDVQNGVNVLHNAYACANQQDDVYKTDSATLVSQAAANQAQASAISQFIQKQTTASAVALPTSLITSAQSSIAIANDIARQSKRPSIQTIIFSLPSKSDPLAHTYTPPIAVLNGDPSNLLIAPQIIQLQAPIASQTAGGSSTAAAGGPSSAPTASASTTVLIAGDGLNRVDLSGVSMVQAAGSTFVTAIPAGNSIKITISTPTSPGSIYFTLRIAGTNRIISTPPISVNAAPQSQSAPSSSSAAPSVTSVQQITEVTSGSNLTATFLLVGNNLNQIDTTHITMTTSPALSPMPTVSGKPVGSAIEVAFSVPAANAAGPFVLSLASQDNKYMTINTPSFPITQP